MQIDYKWLVGARFLVGAVGALLTLIAFSASIQAGLLAAALTLLAALITYRVSATLQPARPAPVGNKRSYTLHVGLALLIVIVGTPMFGLPGLLVYQAVKPFMELLFALSGRVMPMYGELGIGWMFTWLWPWSLPVAYRTYARVAGSDPQKALLAYAGVLYGWALLLTLGLFTMMILNR